MITEDYISFETAKLLKEKGFPQYTRQEGFVGLKYTIDGRITTAPYAEHYRIITQASAMKWLREAFNILIVIDRGENFYAWQFENNTTGKYIGAIVGECPSYEEACEAAIKYCLKNLI